MRYLIPLMSLALLAGCNSSQPPADEPVNGQSGQIDENGVPVGTDAVIAPDPEKDEAATSQAATDAEMAQPMGKAFPKSFQGRWGLVAGDCTSTRGDAKGLLTITGDQLRFYESIGTVKVLTVKSPVSITADLAFTGEGQEWKQTTDYTLVNGGRTMVRVDHDPRHEERYTRCG
ncbi:hypothetical protein FSZ31_05365 [Sphingorhabdus soli]|uniref:Lipoprotein n=1 Tax=Flavisphingopyxis soli TaxID=2601267 RepID=A0A5C6UTU6_9SPHN|nr:hypothetical protein [Sphingorhabdus soli]TXC74145.1 hypothetical protein FSZ31_05365 [Sphingorhabdus soli]